MPPYPAFPYRVEFSGATTTVDLSTYVSQLVRLVLQTDPGERVNRPTFGGGLKQLVFAGMTPQLLAAAETLIHGTLMQWLSDVIAIQGLTVTGQDSEVLVTLTYVVTHTQQTVTQSIRQGVGP